MAKKTATEKTEKGDKSSSSTEKSSGDKTPAEPAQCEPNEQPVELEPYTPTGNFEVDFSELCTRAGFPMLQVVPRPKRPATPSPIPQNNTPTLGKADKKEDKKDDGSKSEETVMMENEEAPPTTFSVKNKFAYFKPRVEVETEEEGNKSHIKEVFIRGWRIDERIMNVLNLTLPSLEKLSTLDFWNTGLSDSRLDTLAGIISHLPNFRTLSLDNNPVTLQRYGVFLGEESTIHHLSLRNCYVNDQGARWIGKALTTNKSLLTLNLCYNKITGEGVGYLSKGLRMNRTLLSLNLGSNLVGDNGASKLAEVISSFTLSHEEIVARRLLVSKKTPEDNTSPSRSLGAPTGGSKERPASVRSGGHLSKEERKSREKGSTKKKMPTSRNAAARSSRVEDMESKKDEKAKKSTSTEQVKTAGKGKKASTNKDKKGVTQPEQETQPEIVEFPNPLLEIPLKEDGGTVIIPGNRALINLNLARNKIGEMGLEAFLIAVQRQIELTSGSSKPTGLMRLSLGRNSFSTDNGYYSRLMEIMQTRDPFYKPPQQSPQDDNNIPPIKEDG